ncbi:MAG: redox-sensing transcriptional repressor Rex [Clostridia bacterium]
MKSYKIPEATIGRLSLYSRYLKKLIEEGVTTVSSLRIAEGVGVTSAQVRKDFAYFGEFGTRGVGYDVQSLLNDILNILGLNKIWNVVLVGAGNLGKALSMYNPFKERGFQLVAIFDNDESKISTRINGVKVYPINRMNEIVEHFNAEIGILTVPAVSAQETCNALMESGIKAILNFSPTMLVVNRDVELRNVDLSVQLEVLTFNTILKKG